MTVPEVYYDSWKKSNGYEAYRKYFDFLIIDSESFMFPSIKTNKSLLGRAAIYKYSLPSARIRQFCRTLGITENAFFAVILTQVFHRLSQDGNIQIATISNGRTMYQLSETIGMFVQILPIVSRKHNGSIAVIMQDMQKQIIDTIRRDKYPYTALVERYGIQPNVLYAYQGDVLNFDGSGILLKAKSQKPPVMLKD